MSLARLSKRLVSNQVKVLAIRDDELEPLSLALQKTSSLLRLFLTTSPLSILAAGLLADVLQANTSLTCLNVVSALTEVESEHLARLLISCKRLCSISLYRMSLSSQNNGGPFQSLVAMLKGSERLVELRLWCAGLLGEDMDVVVAALLSNKTLRNLSLHMNMLGDVGAQHFAKLLTNDNCRLRELSLAANGITHIGASALATALVTNDTLKELILDFNHIADVGAVAVATMILKNNRLQELGLRRNAITQSGLSRLSIAMHNNMTLTRMDVRDNSNGRKVMQQIRDIELRNLRRSYVEKAMLRRVLLSFLGVRKLHPTHSGIWKATPRDVVRIIAFYAWSIHQGGDDVAIPVIKKRRYPKRIRYERK